ncbi:BZ3500_MvSof-1268-A1-R1_Chr4-3g07234 [Microbotryum saponariae]|uniref:BZ3500_MvSof-1268-A1-R1_Chr4-3g07234 protein n=1 Tax=Microbotryum saponariae TaxID=289078 RepID=A0A2X0LF99_9BASI|nr:BZ3500_MvSof-1268-A1-R1_Chr4-3g07234 [Microbotryum saponariae]SDA06897.1 BZ3501_MvSof-1269-A2-R1_Chr4-2g06943 [Microbotryum saponariae]
MPPPSPPHSPTFLPLELLESQLEALDLLESLYPLQDEFELITPPTREGVEELRGSLSSITSTTRSSSTRMKRWDRLTFRIRLDFSDGKGLGQAEVSMGLPLHFDPSSSPRATQRLVQATLHQPSWLPRGGHTALLERLPISPLLIEAQVGDAAQFLIDWLQVVREGLAGRWKERGAELESVESTTEIGGIGKDKGVEEIFRVWFLFQSLSTREKREDIVNWAKEYHLTGFVLAGKPALLCLEGESNKIDQYMSEIKSVSWSDIPSFQKKVSERHRIPITSRIFSNMSEITSLIEKGGFRNNRIEMGQVKEYLVGKGLGEVFGLVVAGGSFT